MKEIIVIMKGQREERVGERSSVQKRSNDNNNNNDDDDVDAKG